MGVIRSWCIRGRCRREFESSVRSVVVGMRLNVVALAMWGCRQAGAFGLCSALAFGSSIGGHQLRVGGCRRRHGWRR